MLTIFNDCGDAIDQAVGLAAHDDKRYTVYRCGDRFVALPEGTTVAELSGAWADANGPIRPVAVYDARGRRVLAD